jgi:uncharacterized membrane protein
MNIFALGLLAATGEFELLLFLSPVLLAVLFFFTPLLTRRGIFFSATVNADFPKSGDGHRLLRSYRQQVALWAVAAIVLVLAVSPLHPNWRAIAPVALLIVGVGFSYWRKFREVHARFGVTRTETDGIQNDARWKAGMVYWNPDDPAIFVPKRVGIGWTFNFANKWSWMVLIAIVVAILIPLFLRAHR